MKSIEDLKSVFQINKKKYFKNGFHAGSSGAHVGGALSIADLMGVLFSKKLILKKVTLILKTEIVHFSKGHACLAYYASLFENKF